MARRRDRSLTLEGDLIGVDDDPMQYITPPPGLVSDLYDVAMGNAVRPTPALALSSALAGVSLLSRNNYLIDNSNTAINLYLLVIAHTGAGKEAVKGTVELLARECSTAQCDIRESICEGFTSGAAVLRALSENPCQFFWRDEVWSLLESINSARGSAHEKQLGAERMSLYGKGNSRYGGRKQADARLNIKPVNRPYLVFVGATTPDRFMTALSSTQMNDGFLNRMLVLQAEGLAGVRRGKALGVPFPVVERVQNLLSAGLDHRLLSADPKWIGMAPGVQDFAFKVSAFADQRIPLPQGAMWARLYETSLRVAGVVAVGMNPENPIITMDVMRWAARLATWSTARITLNIEERMCESPFDAACKKAMEFVASADGYLANDARYSKYTRQGMPHGKLMQLMKMERSEMRKVIDFLLETGVVTGKKMASGSQTTILYTVS
jgi:hypothetical protein